MDSVTVPRSFRDTTPAEQMRPVIERRKSASPSQRSPILENSQAQTTYNAITPSEAQASPEEHTPERTEETRREPWLGRRVWDGVKKWERQHLELVLENKQSVARDHLGTVDVLGGC